MSRLFHQAVTFLLRKAGTLLVILAILVAAQWVADEWKEWRRVTSDLRTTESLLGDRRADLDGLESEIARLQRAWDEQTRTRLNSLNTELRAIDDRLVQAEQTWHDATAKFASLDERARDARRAADQARRERDSLEQALRWWDWLLDRDKVLELQVAEAEVATREGIALAWEKARDKVAPLIEQSPIDELRSEKLGKAQQIDATRTAVSPEVTTLRDRRGQLQRDIQRLESLRGAQRAQVEKDPTRRLLLDAQAKLPVALWILVGVILLPILTKLLFYFVLAPLAERLPPIRIMPGAPAAHVPRPAASAVSIPLDVAPQEELLVKPDFIQSSSRPARKATKWLLNPRIPFSSLASGMFALTSIRPEGGLATQVVVSSQNDPLGEISLVDLPQGAVMIMQPRSLVGVQKREGIPIEVTRHWRLASVHAWLTLQLRYLAFHGPCKLIVQGCRGVRAEQPGPGQPRLINQGSTLGFSPNLDYRNTRCETFVSYFRGQESLFNDLFAGGPGWFIYEEMPARGRGSGLLGRGLEGVIDAFLKAFGI